MQNIPISAVPSQTFSVTLGEQPCQINLYTLYTGLFFDLLLNNVTVVSGALCHNLDRLVRNSYSGFVGDLVFNDTQGVSDPEYSGLGDRYQLLYLSEAEITAAA